MLTRKGQSKALASKLLHFLDPSMKTRSRIESFEK
jgi:hypothetical protein